MGSMAKSTVDHLPEQLRFFVDFVGLPLFLISLLLAIVFAPQIFSFLPFMSTFLLLILITVVPGVILYLSLVWSSTIFRNRAGKHHIMSIPEGPESTFEVGQRVTIGFRRATFVWSEKHVSGATIKDWEHLCDKPADKYFRDYMERNIEQHKIRKSIGADGDASNLGISMTVDHFLTEFAPTVSPILPAWVDRELLDEGCKFYERMWPFISYQFSWALFGGFGAESASAVLLKSRYWASEGETGLIDTWRRLRETLCFLYDIACHGAGGFEPGQPAWKSCMHVRFLHTRTRYGIWRRARLHENEQQLLAENNTEDDTGKPSEEQFVRQPSHDADNMDTRQSSYWDSATFGEPINQSQLIGTLLGSSILLLQGMEELSCSEIPTRQKEGFVHLWRVVGHLFGIQDDLNPNTSFQHGKIIMESMFTFGIAAAPREDLTAVLTKHILNSVSAGVKYSYGVRFVTPGLVSVPSWLFLGPEYGSAIGLPQVTRRELFMGRLRAFSMGLCLFFYFRTQPLLQAVKVDLLLTWMMGFVWRSTVKQIHTDQPKCRFGVLARKMGGDANVCPAKGTMHESKSRVSVLARLLA